MKLLLAYQINGQTVGIDIQSWNDIDLNGNNPFKYIYSGDTIPSGYINISSLLNWGIFGDSVLNFNNTRMEMRNLLPDSFTGLTQQEIEVVQKYSLDDYCMIYDYIDYSNYVNNINPNKPPMSLDYDIIGLHKKRYLVKGELVKVEYYGEYDHITKQYSKLVVSEDRVYYRENQMVSRREMTINWYDNDGSVCVTKNTTKYYSITESMQELDTRRANVISDLKINTVGLIMMCSGVTSIQAQAIGRPFMSTYSVEISSYLHGYEQELNNAIYNDTTFSWLNAVIPNSGGITIRMYLLNGLDIDYEINNINT